MESLLLNLVKIRRIAIQIIIREDNTKQLRFVKSIVAKRFENIQKRYGYYNQRGSRSKSNQRWNYVQLPKNQRNSIRNLKLFKPTPI
ncbi:unnamed protein product (macronuclear) [Paramecium tetraurelia]|uniref:Uncharacterized protein n=1 Tax=Paramecium tetraurelia TaxID=5888 RepID=A0DW22_PARTE|nr:uncharacterized protein GSPATT00020892001 [Paramecium tetraurelia]CAK87239.1 unnamed protein product [Paramecium tetraurelia]|eukprot:XP_001454636.1 hypothetical protein (macronuclear) [Paramecium tetraurelia strain d4-2]